MLFFDFFCEYKFVLDKRIVIQINVIRFNIFFNIIFDIFIKAK